MGYVCPKCGHFIPENEKGFVWHLKSIHNLIHGRNFIEHVKCGQVGCERTFSGRTFVYIKHLKSHRNEVEVEYRYAGDNPPGIADEDSEEEAEINFELDVDNVQVDDVNGAQDMWDNFDSQEVENRASMLVSGLLASSSVVHSTVEQVVEQASDLIEDISSFMKNRVALFATASGISTDDENFLSMMDDFESVSHPFENFITDYKRRKFFQNCVAFVQSQQLPLAIGYYPQNNPISGNVQQVMKSITFQYIPIATLMKLLLEQTDLLRIASAYEASDDNVMRDFHDGSYVRQSEFLSSSNTMKIILYVDDFEVTNPLSPKAGTHKLGAVYFTLASVPPKYRSTLKNMFLLMLYNSSDAKLFGYEQLFAQLVRDMNTLAADGIDIHTDYFEGNIKASVAQVVGDNLGIHSLFGFAEGFTANYLCRTCKMHRDATRQEVIENNDVMRTVANYETDLQLQNLQETGIKSPCPLNQVDHFHVINNRAPDIMHDMLEGICPLEVKLVLGKLIQKGYFTLKTLNSRITSFNYGIPDKSNKPSPFNDTAIRSPDGAPGQNAGQMWCLMRHLAVMLGDLVPEDDEHWDLILALLECMDIIFSPVATRGKTIFLEQLIRDHHMLFLQLFPDRHLKPKHHFITHYPSAIRHIGPLIHLWVMRFEAFHNFSRRLSHIVCNFQNIAKTLAYRNQILLCYNVMSKKTLVEREDEVGPGESVILASMEYAEIVAQSLHVPLYDEVFIAKWCKVFGTKYCKNLVVILRKTEFGDPVFGKIKHVLFVNSNAILVCEVWHTVGFNRHFHAYTAYPCQHTEVAVVEVDSLLEFIPLHASKSYQGGKEYYISLRHSL